MFKKLHNMFPIKQSKSVGKPVSLGGPVSCAEMFSSVNKDWLRPVNAKQEPCPNVIPFSSVDLAIHSTNYEGEKGYFYSQGGKNKHFWSYSGFLFWPNTLNESDKGSLGRCLSRVNMIYTFSYSMELIFLAVN